MKYLNFIILKACLKISFIYDKSYDYAYFCSLKVQTWTTCI
uniref:Uncharacterized protein n=1 Tax=Arundo donax TaxID=35708 RepID=A0A0A8ZP68_ARUDO